MNESELRSRWRLVLGKEAETQGLELSGSEAAELDDLLEYALQMPQMASKQGASKQASSPKDRRGSLAPGHNFTVPDWIDRVKDLFPQSACEVMEREIIKRRGIEQFLQSPEVMERIEPDVELVKAILSHKDLLRPETRSVVRKIITQVVEELKGIIKLQVEPCITGALRKDRHSSRKVFRNLDIKTTIRRNLHNWNEERQQLLIYRSYFYAAERHSRPWHIIIAVDQSGSMLDSAVYSTVMASIFAELPAMRTSLFLFDTEIADLSDQVGQPVDVLLSLQLGGGTHIAKAMRYAEQLVQEPHRSIVILISDFMKAVMKKILSVRQVNYIVRVFV